MNLDMTTLQAGSKATPGPDAGAPAAVRGSASPEVCRAWLELSPVRPDPRVMDRNRIISATRHDQRHVAVDILRTKVMKIMRENGWSTLAITSPTPGCGKSTVALNLAFSFARQSNFRLTLMDLDMRVPGIARLLGCQHPPAIERFLRHQAPMSESLLRLGEGLSVAPNGIPVTNAAELLEELATSSVLGDMRSRLGLDLMVLDLPPMLANDDVLAILPAVDCVLLVAGAEESSFNEIDVCERNLASEGKLLGVVLNKCRYDPEKYGY